MPDAKMPTATDILAAPQETPAGSEPTTEIPPEVLQIPVMYNLLNGAPPAVWVERTRKDPEIQTVVKNQKALVDAGFGFYQTKDGKNTVFYNGAYVSPEEIKKEDEAGTLLEKVPNLDSVKQSVDAAVSGTPPEAGSSLPGEPVAQATPSAAVAGGNPPSSRTMNTLATARVNNLALGSPTSGPVPGRGRILNNILKPTV